MDGVTYYVNGDFKYCKSGPQRCRNSSALHLIQKHLHLLSVDFERFQKRMDNLARHIEQAHTDVSEVHTSAKKITQRFNQIEQVELESQSSNLHPLIKEDS